MANVVALRLLIRSVFESRTRVPFSRGNDATCSLVAGPTHFTNRFSVAICSRSKPPKSSRPSFSFVNTSTCCDNPIEAVTNPMPNFPRSPGSRSVSEPRRSASMRVSSSMPVPSSSIVIMMSPFCSPISMSIFAACASMQLSMMSRIDA